MTEQFANLATVALSAPCLVGDTSITVSNSGALPSTGTFRLLCESEIMLATSRAGAVVMVTRGTEGSVAVGHANLTPVEIIMTAAGIAQLKTDLLAAALAAASAAILPIALDGGAGEVIHVLPVANGGTGQANLTALPLVSPVVTGISEFDGLSYGKTFTEYFELRTTTNAAAQVLLGFVSETGITANDNEQLDVDVEISAVQEGSTHGARWKYSQSWLRQGASAPLAYLATPANPLTTGSDTNAPPSGWVAALVMTGAGPYVMQIQVATGAAVNVRWNAVVQYKRTKST